VNAGLLETLAALALGALGLAGLALATQVAVGQVGLVRERALALALARARLETLRAGPRTSGADDVVVEGVAFARAWTTTPGRGAPDALAVDVRWGARRLALATEALP
jgi:hypothetical protein